jgi:hypothetical protein
MARHELFAISKNGTKVTYDPINSHASTHFADTPQIRSWVKKIIESTDVDGEIMEFDTDTGELLGTSDLVKTDNSDTIVYAIRENRDHHARFTKSRSAQPSSILTISLGQRSDGTYDLFSAWLGPLAPPFPGSPKATSQSKPFWSTHALAWGNQKIKPGTETTICPW